MKRIFLFLAVNFAIMLALTIVYHVAIAFLGSDFLGGESGLAFGAILVWAIIFGAGGSFISLLLSKPIAKMATGARVIDPETTDEDERWLLDTVGTLARGANVAMPEVAIYPGEANAFATGAFRNSSLVAVSTDILEQMTREELRAVLAHEMSHVANGDMVTMTLVQGALNACVLFLSRVIATVAATSGDDRRRRSNSGVYLIVYYVLQIALGFLASLVVYAYSRRREYAADAGSANLLGSALPMIAALRRLDNLQPGVLPDSLKAFGIAGGAASLFSTHPSIEERVKALENWRPR